MPGFVYSAGEIEATATIDRTEFDAVLSGMQADAQAFADQTFTGPTFDPQLQDGWLGRLTAELEAFTAGGQGIDINPQINAAGAATVKAELEALFAQQGGVNIDPTLNQTDVARVLSELDAIGAVGARTVEYNPTVNTSDAVMTIAELTAIGAVGRTAGASVASGGILAMLGWRTGMLGIGAGFGSLLGLMGFGFEHLLVTAIGVAGSIAGAFLGGFALMAGAMSIFAVGFVTDLGGIGQAAGDIKTVSAALSTYQTAAQGLNKVIPQTAAAQAALNTALAGFAPAAQSAVLAAALTANQFHWLYDQATGTAEAIGANILNQLMQVGEKFLPILGSYATKNMQIIQTSLQPLFSFLGTSGLAIFTNLENIFTSRLPTAMSAFDQGIELLMKTLDYLANQTSGGFMIWLNNLLTYLNTPTGLVRFEHSLSGLIGMFDVWWALLKQIGVTIYDFFSQTEGLGTAIASTLTGMLKSLDQWILGTGKGNVDNLFTVHKQEVISLLQFLGQLIAMAGQIYIVIVPPFVTLANILLKIGSWVLSNPVLSAIIGWGAAVLLLSKRLGDAYTALKLMSVGLANLVIKGINLIPGVNISSIGSGGSNAVFSSAVSAFSAAVERFAVSSGLRGASVPGGAVPIGEDVAPAGLMAGITTFGSTLLEFAPELLVAAGAAALVVAALNGMKNQTKETTAQIDTAGKHYDDSWQQFGAAQDNASAKVTKAGDAADASWQKFGAAQDNASAKVTKAGDAADSSWQVFGGVAKNASAATTAAGNAADAAWQKFGGVAGTVATAATNLQAKLNGAVQALLEQNKVADTVSQMLKDMGITGQTATNAITDLTPAITGFSTTTDLTAGQLKALTVQGGLTTAQLQEIHDTAHLTAAQMTALSASTGLTKGEIDILRGSVAPTGVELAILEAQTGLTAAQIKLLMTHTQLTWPQLQNLAKQALAAAQAAQNMAGSVNGFVSAATVAAQQLITGTGQAEQTLIHMHAAGGSDSVVGGVPYIVGEKGPELRVFNQGGAIIPAGKFRTAAGGAGNLNLLGRLGLGSDRGEGILAELQAMHKTLKDQPRKQMIAMRKA